MTILHRNKHDPKHGSRVPQTTRARSVYGRSILSTAASPPPIWEPSVAGDASELVAETLQCLGSLRWRLWMLVFLVNSWWRGTIAFATKKDGFVAETSNKGRNIYIYQNRRQERTHAPDGGRNGHGSGGPGTLEHSAVTMHHSCSD